MAPEHNGRPLPPPTNGLELRLDALIDRVDRLIAQREPAAPAAEPERGETELREPAASARKTKAKAEDGNT